MSKRSLISRSITRVSASAVSQPRCDARLGAVWVPSRGTATEAITAMYLDMLRAMEYYIEVIEKQRLE